MAAFLALAGCASQTTSDIPEAVRQGFWAAHDSAHVGDFAKSEAYLDATAALVPPPKVRLKFTVAMQVRPVPKGSPAPAPTPVAVLPKDAPPSAVTFDQSLLFSSPGAVAEQTDLDTFTTKTAPAQQDFEAKQRTDAVAEVSTLHTALAAASKWKWALIAIGVTVLVVAGVAIYLKVP